MRGNPSFIVLLSACAATCARLQVRNPCGETATKICYGLGGGDSQQLDVDDIAYAAAYLRNIGQTSSGSAAFWTMPPAFDCGEWLLPLPEDFPVLALAKHIKARQNSSVLYEDIANTIDGGGENASDPDKYKALLGCASHGGQLGVIANADNPAYKTAEYVSSGAKPSGILIKLVRNPSAPKPAPQPTKTNVTCDFNKRGLDGWVVLDGSFDASSGELVVASTDSGKAVYDNAVFDNFQLEADISVTKPGGNGGLLFRVSSLGDGGDNYHGYYVGLDPAGWIHFGRADGGWTNLKTVNFDSTVDRKYHIRVLAVNDVIHVYVDSISRPVLTYHDATYTKGLAGVRVWHTGLKVDNFHIQEFKGVLEDFDDGKMSNWKVFDGNFDAKSGELVVAETDNGKAVNNAVFDDFILEADITITKAGGGGNGGFLFRVSDLGNGGDNYHGYYVGLDPDGWIYFGRADGQWTNLKTERFGGGVNKAHHTRVRAVKDRIQIYVADMSTPIITYQDKVYAKGSAGVRVWHTGMRMDNFRIQPE